MTLPGVIRHNLGLKLVSLGLGSLVYFHVASNQPSERQVMIPIEVARLPGDLALLTPPPERARVVFRGRGRDLLPLRGTRGVVGPFCLGVLPVVHLCGSFGARGRAPPVRP